MLLRRYVRLLILPGIVLGLALPASGEIAFVGSFVWAVATLIFLPWALYSLVRIAIRPAERRDRALRLAIWSVAVVAAAAAKHHADALAYQAASSAVAAIQEHRHRTGAYPLTLQAIAIDAKDLREKYSLVYRLDHAGKPALLYSQPSMPTIANHYDFARDEWTREH